MAEGETVEIEGASIHPRETQPEDSRETGRLRKEFQEAASLGRGWMRLIREREERRYTPYLSSRLIPSDHIKSIIQKEKGEDPPTSEDIRAAQAASLGITLEAATQITKAQLLRTGAVRENLASLEGILTLLGKGRSAVVEDLLKSDPQMVREEMRKTIARWERKTPEEVNLPDAVLEEKAKEILDQATNRISRAERALRGYFGR